MARSTSPGTPEEIAERAAARAAKLESLHATLTEQVAALRDSQDWRHWLDVASRFHAYSLNNVLLIAAQRPQATTVAGFSAWKALGRQVGKGERGIAILAPIVRGSRNSTRDSGSRPSGSAPDEVEARQPDDASAAPSGVSAVRQVSGFKVAYVFDVSQTSGRPLPPQPVPALLAGQAPPGLWDALAIQVTGRGFTLRRGDCGPDVNGVTHYADRTVTVRDDVDDAQAVKTLAHELAHVLLHDPTGLATVVAPGEPAAVGEPALRAPGVLTSEGHCRGRVEVEAESVAYLVAATHGLDTGSYTFPYVARWASSVDAASRATPDVVVRGTAQRVLTAARVVLERIDAADPSGSASTATLAAELGAAHTVAADGATRTGTLLAGAVATERVAGRAVAVEAAREAAQRALAEQAGRTRAHGWPAIVTGATAPTRERLLQVHELAVAFYAAQLDVGPGSQGAREMLSARGVDADIAALAQLGYAPPAWTRLVDQLRAGGVKDGELLASGLAMTTRRGTLVDRFRDRIVFPISDETGGTVALIGRVVDDAATDRRGHPVPKYVNSPETDLYRKGGSLYGLGQARDALAAGARPVLVEGPMDVLAIQIAASSASGAARFVGVAPCGTALTTAQVALLDRATGGLAQRGVVVAFDSDEPGRQAAVRAFGQLRQVGAWPHGVELPVGQDPAGVLERNGPHVLQAALQGAAGRPLADLVVDERIDRHADQLRWAEGQLAACREAAQVVVALPPEQVGRQVVRLVARLDMAAAEVSGLVVDALLSRRDLPAADASPRRQLALPVPPVTGAVSSAGTAARQARIAFPLPVSPAPAPAAAIVRLERNHTAPAPEAQLRRQA